jgi:hypothetical protein
MKKNGTAILLIGSAAIGLSGCDSLRNTFGLDHYQADEFNVGENPPLSMPPSYNLVPPGSNPSGDGKNLGKIDDQSSTKKAKEVLFGTSTKTSDTTSHDAKSVVAKASEIQPADPTIRETVTKEKESLSTDPNSLPEKLSKMGDEIVKNAKRTSNEPNEADQANDAQTKES